MKKVILKTTTLLTCLLAFEGLFGLKAFAGSNTRSVKYKCTQEQTAAILRARSNALAIYNKNSSEFRPYAAERGQLEVVDCIGKRLRQPMRYRCFDHDDGYEAKTIGAQINDAVGAPITFRPSFMGSKVQRLDSNDKWQWVYERQSLERQTHVIIHELSHNCGVTDEKYIYASKGDYFAVMVMLGKIPL